MAEDNNYLGRLALGEDYDDDNVSIASRGIALDHEGLYDNIQETNQSANILGKHQGARRDWDEGLNQHARSVIKGGVGALGGMATAGGVIADNVLGTNTAPYINNANKAIRKGFEKYDDYTAQANRPVREAKSELINQRNQEKYGDSLKGAVSTFGDILGSASGEDILSTTFEGIGSLLVPAMLLGKSAKGAEAVAKGAALTGGAKAISKIAGKKAGKEAAEEVTERATKEVTAKVAKESASTIDKAVESMTNSAFLKKYGNKRTLAAMAIIGSMEGGEGAGEFISAVFDTPFSTLYDSSKQFRDLINDGYSEEEARKAVAKTGALQVVIERGLYATAASTIVAPFEANLFKPGTFKGAVSNMFSETIEETAQEAGGKYIVNKELKDRVDKDTELYGGVGEGAAWGAVGGLGSAGVVQSPGVAVNTVTGSAKGAMNLYDKANPEEARVSTTVTSPTTRAEAVQMKEKLKGKTLEEAFDIAEVKDPRMFGRSRQQYESMTRNKEDTNSLKQVAKLSAMADLVSFDVSVDNVNQIAPTLSQEQIAELNVDERGNVSPVEAMLSAYYDLTGRIEQAIEETGEVPADLQEALQEQIAILGETVVTKIAPFSDLFKGINAEELIDTSTPEGQALSYKISGFAEYSSTDMDGLKGIYEEAVAAYEHKRAQQAQQDPQAFVNENVDFDTIFGDSDVSPEVVDLARQDLDLALDHLDNVDLDNMPKEERDNLRRTRNSILAMKEILELYADTQSTVESEIFTNDRLLDDENSDSIGKGSRSIKEFIKDIHNAARTGDVNAVKKQAKELGDFVAHLRNKANAVNKSAEGYKAAEGESPSKSTVSKFNALGKESRKFDHQGQVAVHLHDANSVKLASSILQNANDASHILNLMSRAYLPKDNQIFLKPIAPNSRIANSEGYVPVQLRKPKSLNRKNNNKGSNQGNAQNQGIPSQAPQQQATSKAKPNQGSKLPVQETPPITETTSLDDYVLSQPKEQSLNDLIDQEDTTVPWDTEDTPTTTPVDTTEDGKKAETSKEDSKGNVKEAPKKTTKEESTKESAKETSKETTKETVKEEETTMTPPKEEPKAPTKEDIDKAVEESKAKKEEEETKQVETQKERAVIDEKTESKYANAETEQEADLSEFGLSIIDENVDIESNKELNDILQEMEEAREAQMESEKEVIEKSLDKASTIEEIQEKYNPSNKDDLAVYKFMGEAAITLADPTSNDLSLSMMLSNTLGNFLANLGIDNSVFIDMFVYNDNKTGKPFFNRKAYIDFARKFSVFVDTYKAAGMVDADTKLNQVNLNDGSIQSYAVYRSFIEALNGKGRQKFKETLNSKTSKTRNSNNVNLIGTRHPNNGSIKRNTIVEGFNYNIDSISPALFANSPFNAVWALANSGYFFKTNNSETQSNLNTAAKRKAREEYEALTKQIMAKAKEEAAKFVEKIMKLDPDRRGSKIQEILGRDSLTSSEKSTIPINLAKNMQTLNIFESDGKGGYKLNDRIFEAFTMAVMDTVFENTSRTADDTDVSKTFDVEKDAESQRDNTVNQLTRNMANKALRILGVSYDRNAPEGATGGTAIAVAADVINILTNVSLTNEYDNKGKPVNPIIEKTTEDRFKIVKSKNKGEVGRVVSLADLELTDLMHPNLAKNKDSRELKKVNSVLSGYNFGDLNSIDSQVKSEIFRLGTNFFTGTTEETSVKPIRTSPIKVKRNAKIKNSEEVGLTPEEKEHINTLNEIPSRVDDFMMTQVLDGDLTEIAEWSHEGTRESIQSDFTKGNRYKLDADRSRYNTMRDTHEYLSAVRAKESELLDQGETDVKFYGDYSQGGEGRSHNAGNMQGQTNKLSREALTPTLGKLDLSVEGNAKNDYLTGIAQGIGLDIDNRARSEVAKETEQFLDTNFPKSLEIAIRNIREGKSTLNKHFFDTLKQEMKDSGKSIDRTEVAIHNFVDYARMKGATTEELSNFVTGVYIEIDGKTKGVGDSMAIYTTNPLGAPEASSKTGTVYTDDMGEFVEKQYSEEPDVYETGAENYKQVVAEDANAGIDGFFKLSKSSKFGRSVEVEAFRGDRPYPTIKKNKQIAIGAVMKIFDTFDVGLTINPKTKEISIKRKFSKSPVMTINYGAGAEAVARAILKSVDNLILEKQDMIAKKFSDRKYRNEDGSLKKAYREEALQMFFGNKANFNENMQALYELSLAGEITRNTYDYEYEIGAKTIRGYEVRTFDSGNPPIMKDLYNAIVKDPFTSRLLDFSSKTTNATAFKAALGNPMKEAVEKISPATSESTKSFAKASIVAASVIENIFEAMLTEKLNEVMKADPSRIRTMGLSRNEYMEVVEAARELGGVLQSGSTKLDLFTNGNNTIKEVFENPFKENKEANPHIFTTKGLSEARSTFERPVDRPVVKDLGVSAVPLFTIGTEGAMLRNLTKLAPKEIMQAVVVIHDGYNSRLEGYGADKMSLVLNLATIHAWKEVNPFKAVSDSYLKMTEYLKSKGMDNSEILSYVMESLPANFIFESKNPSDKREEIATLMEGMEINGEEKVLKPMDSNGVITNGMNGADVPVKVTKDGKTNVVPLMEAIYVAEHLGIDIDVRELALSEAFAPVAYDIDSLGQSLKDGSFKENAIKKYEEGKLNIEEYRVGKYTKGESVISKAARTTNTTTTDNTAVEGKEVPLKEVAKEVVQEGYKDSKDSKLIESKKSMFTRLMDHPMLKGFTFKTVPEITSSSGKNNAIAQVRLSSKEILLRSDVVGTERGADSLIHEMIHVPTAHFIKEAILGTLNTKTKTGKVIKSVVDDLTKNLQRMEQLSFKEGSPESLSHFINNYIPNADKDGNGVTRLLEDIQSKDEAVRNNALEKLIRGVAEVVTHSNIREDFNGFLDQHKITDTKESKAYFKFVQNAVNGIKKLKAAIFNALGVKDFRSIKTLADQIQFNTETLIEIATGKDYEGNDPNPPRGGGKPSAGKPKREGKPSKPKSSEVGKAVQETLDFGLESLDSLDSINLDEVTSKTEALREETLRVSMERGLTSGMFDSVDQLDEATSIAYALEYSERTDPVMYSRVGDIYEEAFKTVKEEDFLPENPTKADRVKAKYNYDWFKDIPNTKEVSPVALFAGMGVASPVLRKALENVKYGGNSYKGKTIREAINIAADNLVTSINDGILNLSPKEISANKHLTELIKKLNRISERRENPIVAITDKVNDLGNTANSAFVNYLNKISNQAYKATSTLRKSRHKSVKLVGHLATLPALLYADKDVVSDVLNGFNQVISGAKVPRFIREFATDLAGRTDFSGDVYDMIKTVKSKIQAFRQRYREEVPKTLLKAYKTPLKEHEKTSITEGVLTTDMSSLLATESIDGVINLIKDSRARQKRVKELEAEINTVTNGQSAPIILRKAKELANFMVNRETSYNLLKNAEQIANLTGETIDVPSPSAVVKAIDSLVSLYAYELIESSHKKDLELIAEHNADGLKHTLQYSNGLNTADINSKNATDLSKGNRLKGYTPLTNTKPTTVVHVSKDDIMTYRNLGYTRVEDTVNGAFMAADTRMKGVFHQGIIQTVRPSVGGADSSSGFLSGVSYGGAITEKTEVIKVFNEQARGNAAYKNYVPIYSNITDTSPVAYQLVPSKEVLAHISPETDFSKLLANHTGRKLEETMAIESNKELVKRLNEMYKNSSKYSKDNHFIDLMDSKALESDPVLKDAVNLIPPQMRQFIFQHNGGKLFVRRDMLNDVTGYRMALITDFWTGSNRFSKEIQQGVSSAIDSILGKGSARKLLKLQYGVQSLMSDARDIIVIRSIVVPTINILSNMAQAIARGISPIATGVGYFKYGKEISRYVDIMDRITGLEAERIANSSNKAKVKELTGRIRVLEESISKLKIAPLIEAGEFSSISNAEIDRQDVTVLNGGLLSYVEQKVDKLPKGISTVAKYAILSKDTALYDILKKATDYGDFIAKAIYYEKLIKNGDTNTEAIAKVREEFVNYDKLQGRTRHTIENLGFAWFWNWKLRSTKTMVSIIRNNPANALIYSFSPLQGAMGVGTPLEESFLARIVGEKSLTTSLGIGQGVNAWRNLPAAWAFE